MAPVGAKLFGGLLHAANCQPESNKLSVAVGSVRRTQPDPRVLAQEAWEETAAAGSMLGLIAQF